jgi:O-antigen/teichoic acid export membrane protein
MMVSIASQAAGAAFNAVIGFALLVFVGRVMAPADFAAYVALLGAATVGLVAIAGGNPLWLYRESVGAPRPAVRARVGLAVAQALLAGAVLAALAGATHGTPALLALLCSTALAMADFVSAQWRAEGRFAREAAWQVTLRIASGLAIVAAVSWVARDAAAIFGAWLLASCVVLATVARRRLAWPRFAGLGSHVALVLPIVAVEAMLALATKGDVTVLSARLAPHQLADYAACTRFTDAALLAFAPVNNVQQRYLGLKRDDRAAFDGVWKRSLAGAMVLGAAAIAASLLGGDWVVAAVFGPQYRAAGQLLPWTALALPFLLANVVLAQALVAAGRERALVAVLAGGVAAWLAGLWLGADAAGLRGAAVGGALAHAALALAQALVLRNPTSSARAAPASR